MRFIKLTYTLGLAIALSVQTLYAQSPFDTVIEQITANNQTLSGQALVISADRLDQSDANALSNPEVEFARVWGRHGIGNKLQLDVSQSFDWPGLYGQRSTAADMSNTAALMQIEADKLDMAQEVRQLLVELVYVRKQIQTTKQLQDNLHKMTEAIDKAMSGGELTIIDKKKIDIETYKMDIALEAIVSRENQIKHTLQGMTTVPIDLSEIYEYPIEPQLDADTYIANIANDPAVKVQTLQANAEQANANVANMSRYPSFSVGYQHQAEMGDRFNGFTVGMALPVFQGRKARRAAIERSDAAQLEANSLTTAKTAEILSLLSDMENDKRMIEIYVKVFGDNKYLELLDKAYHGGQLHMIDYLQEIQYYHEMSLMCLESEYQYNQALASLHRWSK